MHITHGELISGHKRWTQEIIFSRSKKWHLNVAFWKIYSKLCVYADFALEFIAEKKRSRYVQVTNPPKQPYMSINICFLAG